MNLQNPRDARSGISRDRRRQVEAAVDSFVRAMDERVLGEIAGLGIDDASEQPSIAFHDEANALSVLMLLGPDRLAE